MIHDLDVVEIGSYCITRDAWLTLEVYNITYSDNRIPADGLHSFQRVIPTRIDFGDGFGYDLLSISAVRDRLKELGYCVYGVSDPIHGADVHVDLSGITRTTIERWVKQDAESEKPRDVPAELKPKQRQRRSLGEGVS